MRQRVRHRVSRATHVIVAGVLCVGLAGCSGGAGGNFPGADSLKGISIPGMSLPSIPVPIHVSLQCMSLDVGKELRSAYYDEVPTVESALDRVNTAARIVEMGNLAITTLPISGGSDWPRKVSGSVPPTEEAKLRQLLQQDPAYYPGTSGQTSALKLKAMYLQTQLFTKYPDLYAPRKMGPAAPAEADVKAAITEVLGAGYSPTFTKVFYRFLQYYPAFKPKADLFAGRLDGKATETYASLLDAVVALADNKPEILQLRDTVLQAEEKKAKEYRDILDLTQRIQKLESAEFGTPSTTQEAVQASDRDTNATQVEELKKQLAVQEQEFTDTVTAYKAELEKLGLEMGKIKTQTVAFTPEQRALAANIQTAVDGVQGVMCQAEVLSAIAGYHIKKAGPNWKKEVQAIARQGGPTANERIRRVTLNLATLPSNLSVLATEVSVLDKEASGYDDLFKSRLADGNRLGGTLLPWVQ